MRVLSERWRKSTITLWFQPYCGGFSLVNLNVVNQATFRLLRKKLKTPVCSRTCLPLHNPIRFLPERVFKLLSITTNYLINLQGFITQRNITYIVEQENLTLSIYTYDLLFSFSMGDIVIMADFSGSFLLLFF